MHEIRYKLNDYIIYCSEFDYGVFIIETDEQVEQANLDENISLFKGTTVEANWILELQRIHDSIEDIPENSQRIELLRSNIKMMCLKLR